MVTRVGQIKTAIVETCNLACADLLFIFGTNEKLPQSDPVD